MSCHPQIVVRHVDLIFVTVTWVIVHEVWPDNAPQVLIISIQHGHAWLDRRVEDASHNHSSFALLTLKDFFDSEVHLKHKHTDLEDITIHASLLERHAHVRVHIWSQDSCSVRTLTHWLVEQLQKSLLHLLQISWLAWIKWYLHLGVDGWSLSFQVSRSHYRLKLDRFLPIYKVNIARLNKRGKAVRIDLHSREVWVINFDALLM